MGTGSAFYSPGMVGSAGAASRSSAMADQALDEEIDHVTTTREELEPALHGRT
ncbi:hypothetical protein ACFWDI_32935 [Streptomyces sp. NPDC060064]|uniref:hypothetical protein n=1 Tax=Streptomyces sp. NPDC060064 TaxID=3347049 RepID=UPI00369ADFBA